MTALNASDFRGFFQAVHGCDPFPWQERLAQRVLHSDRPWPEAITLPTASGKTSCIDIAVFALAAQADLPAAERTAARRIAFVVDRRIIVDEAFERARTIARKLREGEEAILAEVASRLRLLNGDPASDPLSVISLRGGIARDQTWAQSATQPLVICSTVDQIGSRLLFRGYGLSRRACPIHAALTGNDILILLDEAHIARPFLQTARAVALHRCHATDPLRLPFHFVVMSATPPATADTFPSSTEELEPDGRHPILGSRWQAAKPATLMVAEGITKKKFWEGLAKRLTEEAVKLATEGRQVIAILVNRVATAKAVHESLLKSRRDHCVLLTGRMRPVDRDRVVQSAEKSFHLSTGAARTRSLERPVFIVATQCLEVGADMDFDGLVTECASLDALRQRFGRLNRGGRPLEARGVVIIRADQAENPKGPDDADPVYGTALPATWKWLNLIARDNVVDFGIEALASSLSGLSPEETASLCPAPVDAPVMMPAHVDVWCQTHPQPVPQPEVSLFLHGRSTAAPEISLCWRADLSPDASAGELVERLSLCPPASAECLSVPLWQFRQWLNAGAPAEEEKEFAAFETDAVTADPDPAARDKNSGPLPLMLCWRGAGLRDKTANADEGDDSPDGSFILESPAAAGGLHHSDIIVLPEESAAFWLGREFRASSDSHPRTAAAESTDTNTSPKIDLGDFVQLTARARPTLRLHPKVIADWPESEGKAELSALCSSKDLAERLDFEETFRSELVESLRKVATTAEPGFEWLQTTAQCLAHELTGRRGFERSVHIMETAEGIGLILRSPRRWTLNQTIEGEERFPEAGFASSRSTRAVLLAEHSTNVEIRVRKLAESAGLPSALVNLLALAALYHDLGKADPRFQAMLLGLPKAPGSQALLAKSARLPRSQAAEEEQRQASGYPRGGRHELLSVRLAEACPRLPSDGWERDLVLHLIAAHHGCCRPWAPVVFDDHAPPVGFEFDGVTHRHQGPTRLEKLDSGVAQRFWSLNRRFGAWGLAYLESLLRLADQRQSASEQNPGTSS